MVTVASREKQFQCLVDPELIIPSEKHETDENFWERMCQVPEFSDYAVLGANTRHSFESFIEDRLDEIYQELSSFLAEPDVYTLYEQIDNLPDSCQASGCNKPMTEGIEYASLYGASDNIDLLRVDFKAASTQCILTDLAVWSYEEDAAKLPDAKRPVLVDVSADVCECPRVFIKTSPTYATMQLLANDAFPRLCFCQETWVTTDKYVGDERKNVQVMAQYLGILNDYAMDVWKSKTANSERMAYMGKRGLSCSPENGNTLRSNKRMKERTFSIDDGTSCQMSWHAKLFPDHNRFYFYVDTKHERIVIGGCTKHFHTR